MFDFDKALKTFEEYLKSYDLENGQIKLKTEHTYGVILLSEYIAEDLGVDDEDNELARLIALLHDIGRFEQSRQFGDFRDYKNIDHAEFGNTILFNNNLIREFIDTDEYDNVIYKAIKNHNKLTIEEDLNKKELLHVQIIRDADKTDNFRVKSFDEFESIFNTSKEKLENDTISDDIFNDFMSNKVIISNKRKTDMDCWVSFFAFIFDFNFSYGLKYIKAKDYINLMFDRIDYKNSDTRNKMEQIRRHSIDYIESRLIAI